MVDQPFDLFNLTPGSRARFVTDLRVEDFASKTCRRTEKNSGTLLMAVVNLPNGKSFNEFSSCASTSLPGIHFCKRFYC